ncbi:MAG: hypothetical protein GTO18_10265 [Anaerolineales bacterium]|nr:hypothetical protein [Anaerolineales bacterium]
MKEVLSKREKWFRFVDGEEVEPMVSPLCDDWSLQEPYQWPFDEPEPFPPGDPYHYISQQLAMAEVCGWDGGFLAEADIKPRDPKLEPEVLTTKIDKGERREYRLPTPYGELTCVEEQREHDSVSLAAQAFATVVIKPWIMDEGDFPKALWFTEKLMDFDEGWLISEGRRIGTAVGDAGVLGVYFHAPIAHLMLNRDWHYHIADYPKLFKKLHRATFDLYYAQLDALREAGFDYLFYMVGGTEWLSPRFFCEWVIENAQRLFERWNDLGGFVLWHHCGLQKPLMDQGIYNEIKPDIMESFSEPPEGDMPSLRWARERLDPEIATKGNIRGPLLLNGTVEEVRAEVRRVRCETEGYRHIVGLADDVLENTPLENCLALVDEARKLESS